MCKNNISRRVEANRERETNLEGGRHVRPFVHSILRSYSIGKVSVQIKCLISVMKQLTRSSFLPSMT